MNRSGRRRQHALAHAFCAERDDILRMLDVERCREFSARNNPRLPKPSAEVAEIMLHKCRLHVGTMTEIEKGISQEWLLSHGCDLELRPPGRSALDERRRAGR